MLEREFLLPHRSITPYGSIEVYHDSRFKVWNRNRFAVGAQIAIKKGAPLISLIHPKKQFVLDVYLMRQNDSRSEPQHLNALGMAFNIYF